MLRLDEESNEGNKMDQQPQDSSEPFFYIALVLKGTEKQYLNLLNYVSKCNGARVIYQCKSLTYLHVARDDGVKFQAASPEVMVQTNQSKSDNRHVIIESIKKRGNSFFIQKST
jgi:hypothetical protein